MAASTDISAADLARLHGAAPANGTAQAGDDVLVDPFPSLGGGASSAPAPVQPSSSRPTRAAGAALDTASEDAFPSLAAPAPRQPDRAPAKSKWTTGSAAVKNAKDAKDKGKGKAPAGGAGHVNGSSTPSNAIVKQSFHMETLVIEQPVLQPKQTVGDVCKTVMKKHAVSIDPSSQMKAGQKETTFLIKGQSARVVEQARKSLISMLSAPNGKDEGPARGGRKGFANAKADGKADVKTDAKGDAKTDSKADTPANGEPEKESSTVVKITVPQAAIARIVGRGGQQINDIKDRTDCQIKIDRDATGPEIPISLRGTKEAIEAAKKEILAIVAEVDDEVTINVPIESKFHRTIIGAGGQGLRELVSRCGGPADPRTQASLVHFPRQGESQDEVRLRGKRDLVEKIKVELEKLADGYRDRVVLAVSLPVALHSALIGRGGRRLQELQDSTGAQMQFPGSRSYNAVGEAKNADEVKDADALDIVKVYGSQAAAEKAIAELKKSAETFAVANGQNRTRRGPQEQATSVKSVPLKYHHVISQGGTFFRNLRTYGVTVDHSTVPEKPEIKPPTTASAADARIDQPATVAGVPEGPQWDIVPNYENAPEGDAEWTLKGKDKEGLARAEKELDEAIEHAATYTHVGFLTLPDRSIFPRIVGSKGTTITRLREETGANIDVGRDNNTIMITGSETSIGKAKEAIETIMTTGRQRDN